jgi:hypothetical protein
MPPVEIACPWPWVDYDGETMETSYRKKAGKYDILREELKKACPIQEVEQATIVVGAASD